MIASARDIADLIGAAAFGPTPNLRQDKGDFAPEFWDLRSGLLGELAQKLVNYRLTLVLAGDFSAEFAGSRALRDFLRESAVDGPIRLADHPTIPR